MSASSSKSPVAVVTGAGRGIGEAIANRLATMGYSLVLGDQSEQVIQVAERIGTTGVGVSTVIGDVAHPAHADALMAAAERLGGVDVLVNNAGFLQQTPFDELSLDDWDRMIAVHLRGTFLCCAAAVPVMRRRGGGVVVNMASQLGQKGAVELAHYAAAKAGIIGLTRSLALELSRHNIRVNAVAPGPINTPLTLAASETWRDRKLAELPLPMFGEPADVASTVAFLISPEARLYVGQTLGPNSGDVML